MFVVGLCCMSVTTKSELGFANDPCSQNGRYKITATIVVLCKHLQSHFLKHKNGIKPATQSPPPTRRWYFRTVSFINPVRQAKRTTGTRPKGSGRKRPTYRDLNDKTALFPNYCGRARCRRSRNQEQTPTFCSFRIVVGRAWQTRCRLSR